MKRIEKGSEIVQKGSSVEMLKNDGWDRTEQSQVRHYRLLNVRWNVQATYDPVQCFKRQENKNKRSPVPDKTASRLVVRSIYEKNQSYEFRSWEHLVYQAEDTQYCYVNTGKNNAQKASIVIVKFLLGFWRIFFFRSTPPYF